MISSGSILESEIPKSVPMSPIPESVLKTEIPESVPVSGIPESVLVS